MKDIIPAKKQSPILGLTGLGGGVGSNIVAGGAEKVYGDDIFSTYVYEGNGTTRDINNGIDISGEGGLVWIKNRDNTNQNHLLFDTTSPPQTSSPFYSYPLLSNGNNARGPSANALKSFNTNGFSVYTDTGVNSNNQSMVSWTFRKQKGFFDIVKYTPSGGTNTISHDLGCVPGMILVKNLDNSENWAVFHRGTDPSNPNAYGLKLNESSARFTGANWNVTATTFDASFSLNNADGNEHIAYLFAGGESTAATARSVDFSTAAYLNTTTPSSDFTMGTGDFTVEYWFKQKDSSTSGNTFQISDTSGGFKSSSFESTISAWTAADDTWKYNAGNSQISTGVKAYKGQWYHVALVRNSGTTTLYINGTNISSTADNTNYNGTYIALGGYYSTGYLLDGSLSNFRVVKGTAVYTSSFKPPTEPLTNISGTVLLCFNDSSVTGSTVTPVTLNSNGNPTANIYSPFDDPDGFKFGEEIDENMIKCGSYIGNGSTTGPEVYLGWEPQLIIFKNIDNANENWRIFDSMRGMVAGGTEPYLTVNRSFNEQNNANFDPTSTGFNVNSSDASMNQDGSNFIYFAIRRPDSAVGKPPETGTNVFAMDTGYTAGSHRPSYDSGFPVDFGFTKMPASSSHWSAGSRLTGPNEVRLNEASAASGAGNMIWDEMAGFWDFSSGATEQAWMWKRYAGFDVVVWKNDTNNTYKSIPHSLGKKPEMIWLKDRDSTSVDFYQLWKVWHSGLTPLNGVLNSRYIVLDRGDAETNSGNMWGESDSDINENSFRYYTGIVGNTSSVIAVLFASVDGISKLGSYTGNGSTTGPTVTTGFQPRLIIAKAATGSGGWLIYDSLRGFGTNQLTLNSINGHSNSSDMFDVSSTGFSIVDDSPVVNGSSKTYIYYAHA